MVQPAVPLPDLQLTRRTGIGEQVLLRTLGPGDVDGLMVGVEDPLTQRWLPLPRPYSRHTATAWALTAVPAAAAAGTSLVRAIEVGGVFAGIIDLRRVDHVAGSAEISYWATPTARGRGVATAALAVLTGWALTPAPGGGLGLGRVEVRAAAGNHASQRVAEKAGFTREGLLRRAGRTHAGPVDLVVYSRTLDDPATAGPAPEVGEPGHRPPVPVDRFQVVPAVYGILTAHGRVLLMRRTGTGYRAGQLGLPAGHLDGGEAAITGLLRELREELAITVDAGACHLATVVHRAPEHPGDGEYVDLFFTVDRWHGTPVIAEPGKCSELVWADPADLTADVVDYVAAALTAAGRGQRLLLHGWS